tara:strand:+ start:180 stop:746 length:567 start_codon:yes stop_codon:yes gene_type:complete
VKLENNFSVAAAPEEAWSILVDVERVAPCLPGAKLSEVIDDSAYRGKVDVKLGPVSLTFDGNVRFVERDDEKYFAILKADGREARGRGGAEANIKFSLDETDGGSNVRVTTDLNLIGPVAQYGRSQGIIAAVSEEMVGQFAKCLEERVISGKKVELAEQNDASASGITIFMGALKRWISKILNAKLSQ